MISRFLPPKRIVVTVVSVFVALNAAPAEELPPAPKGYFNDYAGVISESKRYDLNERLAKFDKSTTNQVVVAIFPKMDSAIAGRIHAAGRELVGSWPAR